MKCIFCNQEIDENAKFCPYCGKQIPATDEAVEIKYKGDPTKANLSIGLGLTSIVIAYFFSLSFYVIIAFICGIFALIYGIKSFDSVKRGRAQWGAVFGAVSVFLSVIFLAFLLNQSLKAQKSASFYANELHIDYFPDEKPQIYHIHSDIFRLYNVNVNYYFYSLEDEKADDLTNDITEDIWWLSLPFSEDQLAFLENVDGEEKLISFPAEGYFLSYDKKHETYTFPTEDEYHFILIIFDTDNNKINIYEFWS